LIRYKTPKSLHLHVEMLRERIACDKDHNRPVSMEVYCA